MISKAIKVQPSDNVVVALTDLQIGDCVEVGEESFELKTDVKAKHKFAAVDFNEGDQLFMYGVLVGKANTFIAKGSVLTIDNVVHQSDKVKEKTATASWTAPEVSHWKNRTFEGYHRSDGQVGTRNVWLFFSLVFCENKNILKLKEVFDKELIKKPEDPKRLLLRSLIEGKSFETTVPQKEVNESVFKQVDVKFITHPGGCGGIRQDATALGKLLAGYVNNPNVAGATVLSLGCQNLQVKEFKEHLNTINPDFDKPILFFEQQQMGTVDEMLNEVIRSSFVEIKKANELKRATAPLSKLKIGLECGGSDGFSGISANPTLGYVSDILAALKGSAILAEFPELCGVEQELVNRCQQSEDATKFMDLMQVFEASAIAAGSGFDMNPSPGNIKDGLITDAMKSAGAAKKGGSSPIVAVLDYGEYVHKAGLSLLNTPGNDVESTTALAGAGANIVLFTTGLGTPTGNPITPVIKVASNSVLMEKMPDIIDIDTGAVIRGEKSIKEMAEDMLEYIIKVASGQIKTKAMLLEQDDFIPWKRGVSL